VIDKKEKVLDPNSGQNRWSLFHRFFCRGNLGRAFPSCFVSFPPTSALFRIPNTATCRRRLVALSHDPWRLLSLGVWLTFCLRARRKLGLADGGGGSFAKGSRDLRSNS